MVSQEKIDSDILAMSELTKEIKIIVQNTFDQGREDLSLLDIEYVLKLTSDVTNRIKLQLQELTV
ncbi:hypothetical protein [Nitrosopumilus sp.]|uniref:hypothetical protein n=1 Tax=Nitrosopumilus sp. TaxID=2024843 RepID=UPI00247EE1B8|nr:hypothetical protein [Nitrosopumilus sp.]MCV0430190.1 hypothetical protein [Nitrosopumilus sp.]